MIDRIEKRILIASDPETVWTTLTRSDSMKQWMGEPEMRLEIKTDWKVGSPIMISGFHHVKFENRGIVLQYDLSQVLKYTHLSSISRLPDEPENYSIIEFTLSPSENKTLLTLSVSNFPTESISKHLEFYGGPTVEAIKKLAEQEYQINDLGS